jgi:hypothetical protein
MPINFEEYSVGLCNYPKIIIVAWQAFLKKIFPPAKKPASRAVTWRLRNNRFTKT